MNEFRRHVSTMDVVVGGVHAVPEDGLVVIASASGSNWRRMRSVPTKSSGWWVHRRSRPTSIPPSTELRTTVLPLESERLQEVYGMPSVIGKESVIGQEQPGRNIVLPLETTIGDEAREVEGSVGGELLTDVGGGLSAAADQGDRSPPRSV